jgi:hypothetical protein
MKIKKKCFSTMLKDLYGRDSYQSHIEVGKEYWYYFDSNTDIFKTTGNCWNKLRVTYIRSGCVFYDFPDAPNVHEDFCALNCVMTSQFVLAEIDPTVDLDNMDSDTITKLTYYFDDEHTLVRNWPNEREIEISEEELNKLSTEEILYLELFKK